MFIFIAQFMWNMNGKFICVEFVKKRSGVAGRKQVLHVEGKRPFKLQGRPLHFLGRAAHFLYDNKNLSIHIFLSG